jgi:hypothetical protein
MNNEYNISIDMVDRELKNSCREYMNNKYNNDEFFDIVLKTFDEVLTPKEMPSNEISSIVYGWMNSIKPYIIDRTAVDSDREELRKDSNIDSTDFKDPFKNLFNDNEDEIDITPDDDENDDKSPFDSSFGDDDNTEDVVPF